MEEVKDRKSDEDDWKEGERRGLIFYLYMYSVYIFIYNLFEMS